MPRRRCANDRRALTDAAPVRLRGTTFAIYGLTIGVALTGDEAGLKTRLIRIKDEARPRPALCGAGEIAGFRHV